MSLEVQHLNPPGLRQYPAFTNVITISGAAKRVIIGAVDPVDESGALVGAGDLAAQTEQIFRNLEVSLAAAGARLEDIVMWRIFIVAGQSLDAAAAVAMRVWGRRPNPPANNVMFVSALGYPGSLITLEAEAVVAA
jgi:enamine deaminase RidA (YjgF/YER057c/UK114 family)